VAAVAAATVDCVRKERRSISSRPELMDRADTDAEDLEPIVVAAGARKALLLLTVARRVAMASFIASIIIY
jgi:hypothetical protein